MGWGATAEESMVPSWGDKHTPLPLHKQCRPMCGCSGRCDYYTTAGCVHWWEHYNSCQRPTTACSDAATEQAKCGLEQTRNGRFDRLNFCERGYQFWFGMLRCWPSIGVFNTREDRQRRLCPALRWEAVQGLGLKLVNKGFPLWVRWQRVCAPGRRTKVAVEGVSKSSCLNALAQVAPQRHRDRAITSCLLKMSTD